MTTHPVTAQPVTTHAERDRSPWPVRAALLLYPGWFRRRYGPELVELVAETGSGPRTVLDLAKGSLTVRLLLPAPEKDRVRPVRQPSREISSRWVGICWYTHSLGRRPPMWHESPYLRR